MKGGLLSMKMWECDVCGRQLFHKIAYYGQILCPKHYKQIKTHGKALDNNPRTQYDKNEYHICGEVTYIDLYDKYGEVIAQAIIDTEDLDKVKYIKWRRSSSGYAMNTSRYRGSSKYMSREILQTDQMVDHKNHNTLDNRKCNLRIVTKSQNMMNSNHKGVTNRSDGRYYAYIKINQKLINLGCYIFEEEALFARWYTETLLFGDYCYPKDKPMLPEDRERSIMEYINKKVQRL